MNNKILEELGENYHYAKTIVTHEVELAKLDMVETSATIAGKLISATLLVLLSFIVLVLGFIVACILLAQVLGSTLYALLVVGGILIIGIVILYFFRESLIINPVINGFYKLFK